MTKANYSKGRIENKLLDARIKSAYLMYTMIYNAIVGRILSASVDYTGKPINKSNLARMLGLTPCRASHLIQLYQKRFQKTNQ